ncbi:MAG: hypothetical protein FWG61_02390, partial [Firmicutes bacterium]|nr:hypothetical protein [Bacillota bacterium]
HVGKAQNQRFWLYLRQKPGRSTFNTQHLRLKAALDNEYLYNQLYALSFFLIDEIVVLPYNNVGYKNARNSKSQNREYEVGM